MTATAATTTRARDAQLRLDRLARCPRVDPAQAGDELQLCRHDFFELVPGPGGLIHSPLEIAAMRALAYDGPRP